MNELAEALKIINNLSPYRRLRMNDNQQQPEKPDHIDLCGEYMLMDYKVTGEKPKSILLAPSDPLIWKDFYDKYINESSKVKYKPSYKSFILTDSLEPEIPPLIACSARLSGVRKAAPCIELTLISEERFDLDGILRGKLRTVLFAKTTVAGGDMDDDV